MCTRGVAALDDPAGGHQRRSSCAPAAARASSRNCRDEQIAIDIEDAIRLNACALAIQVFIGGEYETRSIHNMTRLVDTGSATASR